MSLLSTLKALSAPLDLFGRAGQVTYAHNLITQSTALDLDVLVPDPLQNGVVAACVNAIARALPDAPLLLENRTTDGWREVPDHECLRVLRAPNADHSDADVWGLTSGYKATRGQAFWLLLPDKLGRVGEINVWNPDLVTVLSNESEFISGYRVAREGGGFIEPPFDKRQVIHFRHLPDFHNPRLGWNPLRTGRAQIAGDNIGASYHTSILHNAGVVSLLISLKEGAATGQVTPEQFQQVLTNIRRASRERSGGVEGINLPLEVHKLAYSPDEMNVDKLIEYYETRICSVMGVNQRVAGLGSDPTYNNLSEALSDFWERRIVPDRNADAATLNRQWLPLFGLDDGNWRFRFDYSGVPALQENRDALHARVRADFEKGLLDKKQARALLGYGTSNDEAFAGVFYGEKPKTTTTDEGAFKGVWNEADHPRDKNGRFGHGGGGARFHGLIPERSERTGSIVDAVDNQAEGGRKKRIKAVLEAINQIHGIENLPRLPVRVLPLKNLEGGLDVRGGMPVGIVLDRGADHLEMTVAHEMGHLIDLMGIGKPHQMASANDEDMAHFRAAVDGSEAIKKLREFHSQGFAPDPNDESRNRPLYRPLVEDDLTYREIWARAYAQYIAQKSDHPQMKEQLTRLQNYRGYSKFKQWQNDDFAPIEHAIDTLFEAKGWK